MSDATNGPVLEGAPDARSTRGVAFVCHPYHRGGVTRWMIDAAAEFRRRGMPVWFLAPEPRRPFPSAARRPTMTSLARALPREMRPTVIAPHVDFRFELGTQEYRASVYARSLAKAVPFGTPVIVSDDEAVWAGASLVADSYPCVGVLHSDEPKYYEMARKYRDRVAAFVAVAERVADRARRDANVSAMTIPCGVPMRDLVAANLSRESRSRLIWIGRTEEAQKRVSDLPRIAAALRDSAVDFYLAVVGDGPEQLMLAQAISAQQLEQHVRLLGWKSSEEIWSLLCESDVLLLPSNFEGMPVVVMEALSAGCAVVASRVSGVEDVDTAEFPGEPLATHEVGDIQEAAKLVVRALHSPCSQRRRSARRMAEALFSIGVCIDRYETLLKTLPGAESQRPIVPSALRGALLSTPLALARATRRAFRVARAER